jgi:hypothetical protein
MRINEDFLDDIEQDMEEVSVTEDGKVFPYILKLKTSVIPKGRGLGFYYDNIVKMNRVIDRALAVCPQIDDYNPDYKVKRLSGGKMDDSDEEQILADTHRFYDDPERINKHSRSMEYEIEVNVKLQTLSHLRKLLLFMWNTLLRAIDASFKAQTSAAAVMLDDGKRVVQITSRSAEDWRVRNEIRKQMFWEAQIFLTPYMKPAEIEEKVKEFLSGGRLDAGVRQPGIIDNQVKKKVMAKLSKAGLQSAIKDVYMEDDQINVRTKDKLNLKDYQIKDLDDNVVFIDVEELVVSVSWINKTQIQRMDEMVKKKCMPNLKKVTIRINTSSFWRPIELSQLREHPEKPLIIDLRGLFKGYDLEVKVKTDEYVFYNSAVMYSDDVEMRVEVLTDKGTKTYKFHVVW